ncbi:MAG: hypothetical protein WD824_03125 [Cyclobacteriaceae bacterium]
MKKLMLAVCLMFGGATLVSAQEQPTTPSQTETTQDQDRQQIAISELPDGVSAKLESQDYSGWTVGNAYKKMDDSNMEIYIVELKQGTETKKVKFDRDGNQIEKDKAHKEHKDKADNNNFKTDESSEKDASEQPKDASDQADNTESETEQQ